LGENEAHLKEGGSIMIAKMEFALWERLILEISFGKVYSRAYPATLVVCGERVKVLSVVD
jgi:hypothetical protein